MHARFHVRARDCTSLVIFLSSLSRNHEVLERARAERGARPRYRVTAPARGAWARGVRGTGGGRDHGNGRAEIVSGAKDGKRAGVRNRGGRSGERRAKGPAESL